MYQWSSLGTRLRKHTSLVNTRQNPHASSATVPALAFGYFVLKRGLIRLIRIIDLRRSLTVVIRVLPQCPEPVQTINVNCPFSVLVLLLLRFSCPARFSLRSHNVSDCDFAAFSHAKVQARDDNDNNT